VFVGIYWQSHGWVAPGAEISGLEDELRLSGEKPRLVYVKEPAAEREARLEELLDRLRNEGAVSYKTFATADELRAHVLHDLSLRVTERCWSAEAESMHELPAQSTSFVGRQDELAAIARLIRDEGVRLLTLTGPGGIGKTRLSIEAAQRLRGEHADGAAF